MEELVQADQDKNYGKLRFHSENFLRAVFCTFQIGVPLYIDLRIEDAPEK